MSPPSLVQRFPLACSMKGKLGDEASFSSLTVQVTEKLILSDSPRTSRGGVVFASFLSPPHWVQREAASSGGSSASH